MFQVQISIKIVPTIVIIIPKIHNVLNIAAVYFLLMFLYWAGDNDEVASLHTSVTTFWNPF
jgi:hypothetical protein